MTFGSLHNQKEKRKDKCNHTFISNDNNRIGIKSRRAIFQYQSSRDKIWKNDNYANYSFHKVSFKSIDYS